MPLLPFTGLRFVSPLLSPLRALVRGQWLRESDVDAVLRACNPGWSLRRVYARVEARQWVADDMLELRLRPNAYWRGARPGQHLQLFVENGGIRHSRSYSLTRVAEDGCLEFAVKLQPGGRISTFLLQQLCVGEVLELGEPDGELNWPADDQGVLLLAAGSGLTPLLGLLREALARGYGGPVTLLHYVRERGQKAFVVGLQALARQYPNLELRWALSGEAALDGELSGRFQSDHVADLQARHVLVCGPGGFVETVRQALGASSRSLQAESFSPPAWDDREPAQAVSLRFARSALQVTGDSRRSLLEQAEASGLRPLHGCRQGVCTRCTCTLVSGCVRDLRSGELFSEPGQPIRICVSAPQGDLTVDL
ncbi:flavin reductase family protein [Pseudomonas nitroreducens]|uniref:flavin reductase family protein n=1 Tax=Pseudomonas nitroreducens TaxID=46680 RepID=UPI002659AEC4|nr:iron-sulfur cluster-binding domain-containing protein [Pseudomonas nitroreducens]MCP1650715.1 ferredoxin-NADP reductase [Pseudomonas nitroreducens]MCP1688667.1 ferredoxin-NADP reductase [Pseudomonas nitroreducens]